MLPCDALFAGADLYGVSLRYAFLPALAYMVFPCDESPRHAAGVALPPLTRGARGLAEVLECFI